MDWPPAKRRTSDFVVTTHLVTFQIFCRVCVALISAIVLNLTFLPHGFAQPAPSGSKIDNPVSRFTGLDKITGRIISFDVMKNETVQFGALRVTPRVCYTRPDDETQQTSTFIEVDEVTLDNKVRRIFTGWMFASSPGLNAIEHGVYDIWLVDCKTQMGEPDEPEPGSPIDGEVKGNGDITSLSQITAVPRARPR